MRHYLVLAIFFIILFSENGYSQDENEIKEKIIEHIYSKFYPILKEINNKSDCKNLVLFFDLSKNGKISNLEFLDNSKSEINNIIVLSDKLNDKNNTISYYSSRNDYQVSFVIPENYNILALNDRKLLLNLAKDDIFSVVAIQPILIDCYKLEGNNRKKCTDSSFQARIVKNLKFSEEAVANKVKGKIIIQFTIDKIGSMSDVKIARDLGFGIGNSIKSIIDDISLKESIWIPGKNSYGKPVSILYTVPIQINLE